MDSISNRNSTQAILKYFAKAESDLTTLMDMDDLDQRVLSKTAVAREFEQALAFALRSAFGKEPYAQPHHLFLQRVLYRINRLKFFWYDDLSNYKNECSNYLREVQFRIESLWEPWERSQLASAVNVEKGNVEDALRIRAAEDLAPLPSAEGLYFRDQMGIAGYRKLLQVASLDGLVEASQVQTSESVRIA